MIILLNLNQANDQINHLPIRTFPLSKIHNIVRPITARELVIKSALSITQTGSCFISINKKTFKNLKTKVSTVLQHGIVVEVNIKINEGKTFHSNKYFSATNLALLIASIQALHSDSVSVRKS